MVALVALVLALVVLASWLSGHWFARVVVLLALSALGLMLCLAYQTPHQTTPVFVPFLLSLPVAWIVASIPTYYWRSKNRVTYLRPQRY